MKRGKKIIQNRKYWCPSKMRNCRKLSNLMGTGQVEAVVAVDADADAAGVVDIFDRRSTG
jgi:hypothetical protein